MECRPLSRAAIPERVPESALIWSPLGKLAHGRAGIRGHSDAACIGQEGTRIAGPATGCQSLHKPRGRSAGNYSRPLDTTTGESRRAAEKDIQGCKKLGGKGRIQHHAEGALKATQVSAEYGQYLRNGYILESVIVSAFRQ